MPKVNDIKAYWREIAAKAGLEGEDLQKVTAVIDNDKFAKTFSESFKPLPDYSHDLDDVRAKTKVEKDAEYKAWHEQELQKYNMYTQGLSELENYRRLYGGPNTTTTVSEIPRTGMTQEEIDKLMDAKMNAALEERLARRDSAVLDLLEIRESHMNTFKTSLDTKKFETEWKNHPEWGGSLKMAYEQFVKPEVRKAEEAEWQKKVEAARQEGIRDGYTRRSLPADSNPKQFSPFFDRKEDVLKMTDNEQEKHSKEAFFEGFRESLKSQA